MTHVFKWILATLAGARLVKSSFSSFFASRAMEDSALARSLSKLSISRARSVSGTGRMMTSATPVRISETERG